MNKHKFIFVCGLHRSGTSVLFRALRQHPEISGFENTPSPEDEGMHLQSVYQPPKYYGGAGYFGFNRKAYLTEVSNLMTNKNKQKLWNEWSPYWDLERPYLLEKSPANILISRFLQAMFPDSYFILIMRHPIAVSLATHQWYRRSQLRYYRLDRLIEHWLICYERFFADVAFLERVKVVRYEDFVENSNQELDEIFKFLNIAPQSNSENIIANINEKYFQKWRDLQKNVFLGTMIKYIKQRYRTRILELGYDLEV